jgi:hypothetical protein
MIQEQKEKLRLKEGDQLTQNKNIQDQITSINNQETKNEELTKTQNQYKEDFEKLEKTYRKKE